MIEKIKEILAVLASLAVVLYATGYIAEVAHANKLGTSNMVQPAMDYYLISGGQFFISTLHALYATLFSRSYYFVLLFIIIAVIFRYETYARKKKLNRLHPAYAITVFLLVLFFIFIVTPFYSSPLVFKNLLIPGTEQGAYSKSLFHPFKSELRGWILNENPENLQKLTDFYVEMVLITIIAAVILYSLIYRWKSWKKSETKTLKSDVTGRIHGLYKLVLEWLRPFYKMFYGILIILMFIIVVTQAFMIPVNYGILLKSNFYPEVNVVVKEELKLLENRDEGKACTLWLLRENAEELLLYAVFFEKGRKEPAYKIFAVKKELVKKKEILNNSFVFKYK